MVSNSVRKTARVGQAARHGAGEQCLQTSLIISQLLWKGGISVARSPFCGDVLDKMNMPPGRRREVAGIVVAGAAQPQIVGRKGVPFLTGDLAGLAPNAQCRVGKEPIAAARLDALPGSQLRLARDDRGQNRL